MSIFKNWITSDAILKQMITGFDIKVKVDLDINSILFDIFDVELLVHIVPPEDRPLFSKKLIEYETDIFVKTGFMDTLRNKYSYTPLDHYTVLKIRNDIEQFLRAREYETGMYIHDEFLSKYLCVNPFVGVVHIDTGKI